MGASQTLREDEGPADASHPERPPALAGGTWLQGHLRELASDHLALFRRCSALNGIVRFRVYWFTCHVLTDPDLAGSLLVSRAAAFKKARSLQVARPTFGNGLLTSEGETWRRQQRLLRAFFTPRAAAGYGDIIATHTERLLANWRTQRVVDLHQDMVGVTLESVCRALFGLDAARLQPLIRDAAYAVQQWHHDCRALCLPYPHYWPISSNFRYRRKTRTLDRAVHTLIGEVRAQGGDQHGLLGAMLQVRDEDGSPISDREIRDQVVTLFLAGHETTAATLALVLYELSYRPDLQARIAEESRGRKPSECLDQALKETLRLYPPVHLVARTALEDVMLGPYVIKRGEEVVLPLSLMQRHVKLFSRPDDFEPERWQKATDPPVCHRYAHLPFSTGPRVCIGQAVAMAELRAIVSAVFSQFRLEPLAPRAPRLDEHMTLAPAAGSTRVRCVPVP